ncbi:MAG: hypothetical protein ACD_73C00268G0002 [uncultured bacterium]|nr:MAG: hypothetical protein ACD_73C00268G0002 [uncultured bacterium]
MVALPLEGISDDRKCPWVGELLLTMSKILRKEDYLKQSDLEARVDQEESVYAPLVDDNQKNVVKGADLQASTKAKSILEEAVREAHEIKLRARDVFSKVEEHAKLKEEEGFKKGREEGLAQITEMMVAWEKKNEEMVSLLEKEITKLVYEIGEKILGREFVERETAIVDLIKQALQSAGGQNVIVLVHPDDLDVVRKNQPHLITAIDASRTLQIRASEKVAVHGCLIETEIGTLDAQLETQLEAIKKALGLSEFDPSKEIPQELKSDLEDF